MVGRIYIYVDDFAVLVPFLMTNQLRSAAITRWFAMAAKALRPLGMRFDAAKARTFQLLPAVPQVPEKVLGIVIASGADFGEHILSRTSKADWALLRLLLTPAWTTGSPSSSCNFSGLVILAKQSVGGHCPCVNVPQYHLCPVRISGCPPRYVPSGAWLAGILAVQ